MNELHAQSAQKALEALSTLLNVTKEQEERNAFYREKYIFSIVLEENQRAIAFKDEDLLFFSFKDHDIAKQYITSNTRAQNVQSLI